METGSRPEAVCSALRRRERLSTSPYHGAMAPSPTFIGTECITAGTSAGRQPRVRRRRSRALPFALLPTAHCPLPTFSAILPPKSVENATVCAVGSYYIDGVPAFSTTALKSDLIFESELAGG